ncbi:TPA: hypothetical protein LVM22_003264 [Klebsiella oxytoca]|nr:hypothetical protein [Klebsiella oxytoca]
MYTTLQDFHSDLEKVSRLLKLTVQIKEFSGLQNLLNVLPPKVELPEVEDPVASGELESSEEEASLSQIVVVDSVTHDDTSNGDDVDDQETSRINVNDLVTELHSTSRSNHSNLVILNGTLLLFITGRFESFVRETFEEYCKNLTERVDRYTELPKEMREGLIKYTSEVISNPRRYGHAENGVKSFVRIMHNNLHDETPVEINYKCLSITSENMRPDVLSDLFKRAGVKNLWEKLSQQSKFQLFWGTNDISSVRRQSEAYLNSLMETRNSIAHPSTSITWPDSDAIDKALNFFKLFGTVLIDVLPVYELDVGNVTPNQ